MVNWTDIIIKEEWRKDQLRQAEKQRLLREARAARRHAKRRPNFVVSWLISWLA